MEETILKQKEILENNIFYIDGDNNLFYKRKRKGCCCAYYEKRYPKFELIKMACSGISKKVIIIVVPDQNKEFNLLFVEDYKLNSRLNFADIFNYIFDNAHNFSLKEMHFYSGSLLVVKLRLYEEVIKKMVTETKSENLVLL